MRRRVAAALVVASVLLAGCGTTIEVEDRGGVCFQITQQKAVGVTTSTSETVIRCP